MYVVIDASPRFRDRTGNGLYADTLEEPDAETGRLLAALDDLVPDDRIIDGVNQSALLLGKDWNGAREGFPYFEKDELQAVRQGHWKLRLPNLKELRNWAEIDLGSNKIELYDLARDLGETTNVAAGNPDVVNRLMAIAEKAKVVNWPQCPKRLG